MRTIASLALAGLVAAAPLAASVTSAAAWDHYGHDWRYHHGYGYWGGPFAGGIALGYAFGALTPPYYAPPPPPPPYPYPAQYTEAHIDWCGRTYNTYSPETNLWVDYNGARHVCVGPY